MLYPLSHALAPSCLLAARLAFTVSSHRCPISSVIVSPVSFPFFDTVERGVRRGASGVLLAWFFPAVCADVDSWLMPFPLRYLLCLLSLSSRLRGGGVLISSCLACCDVLLARHLVSSIASSIIPSVGSVLRLLPRLATRWAGRRADAVCLLSVLRFDFFLPVSSPVLACLGAFPVPS